jgi:hypothetical protein
VSRFDEWLADSTPFRTWVGDKSRPASVGNIILDNPVTIRVLRDGTYLSEQVVRIATLGAAKETGILDDAGIITSQTMVVLGYKNHPDVTDTDLQTEDRFAVDGRTYRVVKVQATHTDRLLAFAEEYNG